MFNLIYSNPFALRKAKIVYNFGLSECNRVNSQKKDSQDIPPLKRRNGSGLPESELEQADFNGPFTDALNKSEYPRLSS